MVDASLAEAFVRHVVDPANAAVGCVNLVALRTPVHRPRFSTKRRQKRRSKASKRKAEAKRGDASPRRQAMAKRRSSDRCIISAFGFRMVGRGNVAIGRAPRHRLKSLIRLRMCSFRLPCGLRLTVTSGVKIRRWNLKFCWWVYLWCCGLLMWNILTITNYALPSNARCVPRTAGSGSFPTPSNVTKVGSLTLDWPLQPVHRSDFSAFEKDKKVRKRSKMRRKGDNSRRCLAPGVVLPYSLMMSLSVSWVEGY